jgi:ElaB/YqjD/DUF883 family membrane-anchored ribosome-binding protein
MFTTKTSPDTTALTDKIADKIADGAQHALSAAQHTTNAALDSVSGNVQDMRNYAAPILANAEGQVREMLQNGRDAVRNTSHQVSDAARHARDGTVSYVKEEPVKAMLIAAATGAALMALVSMVSHSRGRP